MIKPVISLLLILSLPLSAAAAEPTPESGKHHGGILGRLSQELNLTDEQKAKAKALYRENKLKTKEKREKLKDSLTLGQKLKLRELIQSPEVRELKSDIKTQLATEKRNGEVIK